MTYVVGQTFDAFAQFPVTANPSQEAKDQLLRSVGIAALQLLGLAFGSFILGSLNSTLWIWIGERNAMALRKRVYSSVSAKDMEWFDTNMSSESEVDGHLGAAGMMAKFNQ
jgi:ATP-binding cassette subfamily B (MDR/TAP) protein 1